MDLSLGFVTWICLNFNWLLAVTGVMRKADDAYSIRSTWSCYWLDQFLTLALNILILSIFYISMDLSTNYFAHFSGCWASFVCSCHSILECCVTFSGVKLSIKSFVLFLNPDLIEIDLLLCMLMESWTLGFLFFIRQCRNKSRKIFCGVEGTRLNWNLYKSKAENAEKVVTTSFGENVLFGCDHIYFPKSKCDCK